MNTEEESAQFDRELLELTRYRMKGLKIAVVGTVIIIIIGFILLLLTDETAPIGTEYKGYTQEIIGINVESRTLLVGNGDELLMYEEELKNFDINDIITYEKAEGYKNVENLKIEGHNNPD